MYYVIRNVSDAKKCIGIFYGVSALMLCFISIYTLSHASASILANVLNEDVRLGCFSGGRFYAMGNANVMGTASAAHILLSVIVFLGVGKRNKALRIFFAVSTFIGWMILGLTGCRTGRIAVSAAACLFSFTILQDKLKVKKGKQALTFLASVMIGMAIMLSFVLPELIYKGIIYSIGYIFKIESFNELEAITLHRIADDDGTMSGRTDLWINSIKSGLKNPKRFFFGISPLGAEKVHGYEAGHHELRMPHAHNTYFEILRLHGFLGFVSMIALVIGWIVNCLKILFFKEKDAVNVGIVAMIAAVLLMGMAEPLPLVSGYENFVALPFFMACGYCMQVGRTEH